MYKEKFENILGENEEIIKIEKAKISSFASEKIVSTIFALGVILGLYYYYKVVLLSLLNIDLIWIKIIAAGIMIFDLVYVLFSIKNCLNYFVCLTNKRIIVRYGTFTNNFDLQSIDKVTGNIQTSCTQSIWDKKDGKDASGKISANIELLPVGHGGIHFSTDYSIENAYEMAKEIEKIVKNNAKFIEDIVKE